MPYNLLDQAWIPVRRADDSRDVIRPCQISETENPPVRLDAPRPDFNGALIQFLIGLIQTTFAPRHERGWRRWFKNPPSPDELDAACDWCRDAFNLDGDGPRFMQDYAYARTTPKLKKSRDGHIKTNSNQRPLSHLLFETPTGNTLKRNQDHFTKRGERPLSVAESVMALLNIQMNAQGSGRGYRVSVRGKMGPLTTVVVGRTLWQTAYLNVLTRQEFEALAGSNQQRMESIFPWMAPTRTSEAEQLVTPAEVHAAQMYWAMPLRKRLLFDKTASHDAKGEPILRSHYYRTTHGINYDNESTWLHPLSPQDHSRGAASKPVNARKIADSSYTDWLGLAANRGVADTKPALVVQKFNSRGHLDAVSEALGLESDDGQSDQMGDSNRRGGDSGARVRLWFFGYEFKDSSAEAWHESEMPLFVLQHPTLRPDFEDFAHDLVHAATRAIDGSRSRTGLRKALQYALFGTYKKNQRTNRIEWDFPTSREDASARYKSVVSHTTTRFWKDTEPDFYRILGRAQEQLDAHPDDDPDDTLDPLRDDWKQIVRDKVRALFNEVTGYGTFHTSDPRSIAQAHIELEGTLNDL